MSPFGKSQHGKIEGRKEVANIALMHPGVYVAQTSTSFINHFSRAVREANAYSGPALINVYVTCQPEHEVPDDVSALQSRRAVNSRAFPLFVHDPRKGDKLRDRLSLQGNPALTEDWMEDPETKTPYTFVEFARTEGRFAKHFDANGAPGPGVAAAGDERLRNWRLLRELAGNG
jgi:pyruvate/2-oxoacid:ferredoxin oxidoreductase beta subunit